MLDKGNDLLFRYSNSVISGLIKTGFSLLGKGDIHITWKKVNEKPYSSKFALSK